MALTLKGNSGNSLLYLTKYLLRNQQTKREGGSEGAGIHKDSLSQAATDAKRPAN